MDNCWFVLRQSHYPPPVKWSGGHIEGPICLGHIVPNLKNLDQVINTSGPETYPANMPLWQSKKWDLKWEIHIRNNVDSSTRVEVPTGAVPVNAKADAGMLFKRSIRNYWEFDRLDTAIIQPTKAYID